MHSHLPAIPAIFLLSVLCAQCIFVQARITQRNMQSAARGLTPCSSPPNVLAATSTASTLVTRSDSPNDPPPLRPRAARLSEAPQPGRDRPSSPHTAPIPPDPTEFVPTGQTAHRDGWIDLADGRPLHIELHNLASVTLVARGTQVAFATCAAPVQRRPQMDPCVSTVLPQLREQAAGEGLLRGGGGGRTAARRLERSLVYHLQPGHFAANGRQWTQRFLGRRLAVGRIFGGAVQGHEFWAGMEPTLYVDLVRGRHGPRVLLNAQDVFPVRTPMPSVQS